MTPSLSTYPPTKKGAEDLIEELVPTITRLWKEERGTKGDDLVVVIDAKTQHVDVKSRPGVCARLRKNSSNSDLLDYLSQPATPRKSNGSIAIWAIIGFADDKVCAFSVTLARS